MAAKPSDPLTTIPWATDTNLSSGPQSGQTTKFAPSLAYMQQGCVPGRSAPGRYMNYFFNQLYQWMLYLHDGVFTGALAVADAPVRARDLPTGGFEWCDAAGAKITPTRTVYLPLTAATSRSADIPQFLVNDAAVDGGSDAAYTQLGSATTSKGWVWHVRVPRDAVVTSVVAGVTDSGAPTNPMTLRVYSSTENLSTPSSQSVARIGFDTASAGAGTKVMTANLSPTFTKNSLNNLYVRIDCSDSGTLNTVQWVYMAFDDPGPRNH